MQLGFALVALLACFTFTIQAAPPTYTTKYYDQVLGYPNGCKGPIFFYTGNESPVTDYYKASGLFTEVLAPKYGGLLVFAEHRYFGESLPFGNTSFTREHIGWLSADQALADYAQLITHLKETMPEAKNCPVIAYGGSYGGMLTTWFRIKYPHITIGGLAASAPFGFVNSGISPFAFIDSATDTYRQAGAGCDTSIKNALDTLTKLATTEAGREATQKYLKLCTPLKDEDAALNVVNWITSGLIDQAMLDYPYPTDYGIKLGAWPVNTTCERISHFANNPVEGIGYAIGTVYNATGSYTCYDVATDNPDFATGPAWPYLACTQVYLPSAQRGMFPYQAWNVTNDVEGCKEQFGVNLHPEWPQIHWGGFEALPYAENIIFSNGLLDPWHSSGVLSTIKPSLPAIVIPEAAHHLDLRGPNPADPIYVKQAREQEDHIIGGWISAFFAKTA